jgi:hypothetical protein
MKTKSKAKKVSPKKIKEVKTKSRVTIIAVKGKKKKVVPKPQAKGIYKVSIQMNGETFETQTDNIVEAIASLNPPRIVTHVVITVWKGERRWQRILMAFKGMQLFRNKLSAQILAKNAMFILG